MFNYDYGRQMAMPNYPSFGYGAWTPGTFANVGWGYGPTAPFGGFNPSFPGSFATPGWGYGPYTAPFTAYPTYAPAPDAEIMDFVERAIDNDPEVPAHATINVDVKNGVVTLTGTVSNKRIKHAAGDDAWWIPPVVDVHNEIEVQPRKTRT